MAKKIQVDGYMCEKCGKIYVGGGIGTDEYLANMCCKQYYCEDCGKPTEKYNYVCPQCSEKRKFDKATKMSYSEYIKKFPDYPIYFNENFYWELEDLKEYQYYNDLEMPEYVWGTVKERVEVDIETAIENAEENSNLEDFYFDDTKELIDFVKKWNEENGTDAFYQSYDIVVVLTPEERSLEDENT